MHIAANFGAAVVGLLAVGTMAWGIEPANPNATANARKVLAYLYELPQRSENRIVSGHLAGGAIGPHVREGNGSYKFTLQEIEYVQRVSGQWVGLIGADYCAGWIESSNPMEDTMYYRDLNRGLIDYWNAGGLVAITTHQFDPRELYKDGGQCFFKDLPKGARRVGLARLYTPGSEEYDNFRVIMDRWAQGLQELADHGVAVLWRLFNEARDGKWWCLQPADRYQTLYRYTFDYMKRFRCAKETLPYGSFFMSWDRVWGPFGRGTPDSVKAMYNDPTVANRGELDWRHTNTNRRAETAP
jgi:hypothetical protein